MPDGKVAQLEDALLTRIEARLHQREQWQARVLASLGRLEKDLRPERPALRVVKDGENA